MGSFSGFCYSLLYAFIGIGLAFNIYLYLETFKKNYPISIDKNTIIANFKDKFIGTQGVEEIVSQLKYMEGFDVLIFDFGLCAITNTDVSLLMDGI